MRASLRRLLSFLSGAVLPLLAAGCLPNATWLPDSSGFVYTGGKDKDALYQYDLSKKAPRALVEKGAGPAWPAISPDGKRIAVALRKNDGVDITLEVIVFDCDGKELHRSEKLNWAKHEAPGQAAAQVFWAPGQDKLLLNADMVTGFYDLKMKNLTKLDVNVATFGPTPIRPDGKGFLACGTSPEGGLFLVDWDGKKQAIKLVPKEAFDEKNDPERHMQGMVFFPLMHSSRWDGSTAVVSWDDVRVKIDADKLTATREPIQPALAEDKNVIQDQVKLPGGAVIRAVELAKRYTKDRPPGVPLSFGSYRVEVVKPGAKEPKVLMDAAGFFMIYPSPDGKKAVVKCSKTLEAIFKESNPDQDVLFLIDANGDVADTIDLAK